MNAHAHAAMIIAEARRWIATPYMHQASTRGIGCDCLGLVRGVWRAVLGAEPERLPAYSSDWGEITGTEFVLQAADRYLRQLPPAIAEPGDLIVFRWRRGAIAKHLGILTAPSRFIHAWEPVGVVEVGLGLSWRRRIAGAYRFPLPEEERP